MSSYIPDTGYGGCKWQSGDPTNSTRGLPYIQGLYVLTEDPFGIPVALIELRMDHGPTHCGRVGAGRQVSMKPGASTLAILGCGLQGRSHLEAVKSVMPQLRRVAAFDIRREVACRLRR